MSNAPELDTSKRFGFEWDRYDGFFPHYEQQFRGWIEPLGPTDFAGQSVLDGGCGMGRNSFWAAAYGAERVLAVDYSELALASARDVLKDQPSVEVERCSLYELDRPEEFDLAFSIGVIHHLEFPRLAIEKLLECVKPGGRLVVWLYGFEGNALWARTFRIVHPILKRLPPSIVHGLAYLCSVPLFLGLKLPLPKSQYLEMVSQFPFPHLHKIVFDQLLPDIARYYKRDEVDALFSDLEEGANVEVHHNRGYSWTVVVTRPKEGKA